MSRTTYQGTSSVLDISSEDEQQECLKCDHALTLQAGRYIHKEELTTIESPSSIISVDSDMSEQSPLNTPQVPEIDITQGPVISNIGTPGTSNTITALQCKNSIYLKINLPDTKKSPKPGSTTTKYHPATQDDDFNFSYSEDQ